MRQEAQVTQSNEQSPWIASSLNERAGLGARLPLGSDAFISPLDGAHFARKPRRFGSWAITVIGSAALVSTSMVAAALVLRASRPSSPSTGLIPLSVAATPLQPMATTPAVAPSPAVAELAPAQAATSEPQVSSDAALLTLNESTPAKRHRRGDRHASKRDAAQHEHATPHVARAQSARDDIIADLLQPTPPKGSASRHRPAGASQDGQSRRSKAKHADRDG
jgi:hypothetical protein